MRWLVVVSLFLAMAGSAGAKTVRVHTVGPRLDLAWVDSKEHFAAKLDGMLATLPRRGHGQDLVVLPEDIGLMAAFSGPSGPSSARTPRRSPTTRRSTRVWPSAAS